MLKLLDMREFLEENGWREYPDPLSETAIAYYKQYETKTRCHCNDEKSGIQVAIRLYPPIKLDTTPPLDPAYEIELCGELKDGTWFKLHQWSIREDIDVGIKIIPRLLAAWECAANYEDTP